MGVFAAAALAGCMSMVSSAYSTYKDSNGDEFEYQQLRAYGTMITQIKGIKDNGDGKVVVPGTIGYHVYEISCEGYPELSSIDLSQCTELTALFCARNGLTSLDVSNNTKLKVLNCNQNQISVLDLSNNKELEKLDCEKNQITGLNLSNNTKLKELHCYYNKMPRRCGAFCFV